MMLSVRWRDVSFCSDDDRPVAQARGGADGREEGRERGYYHLHRQLDDTLFLHFLLTDRLFFYLTQKSQKSQKFYVLRTLLLSRRNERNKGNFRFTLYAQPVPKALSVISVNFCVPYILCAQPVPEALSFISFISAGLKILCAACAEGTFCDFREFLCDL